MDNELRREIIMDNYQYPYNREVPSDLEGYIKVNSNNESCIDNIDIYIKIENDKIVDIKFMGEACAISTSATSVMIKLLIGKTLDEEAIPITLGKRILRTETAGLTTLSILMYHLECGEQLDDKNIR